MISSLTVATVLFTACGGGDTGGGGTGGSSAGGSSGAPSSSSGGAGGSNPGAAPAGSGGAGGTGGSAAGTGGTGGRPNPIPPAGGSGGVTPDAGARDTSSSLPVIPAPDARPPVLNPTDAGSMAKYTKAVAAVFDRKVLHRIDVTVAAADVSKIESGGDTRVPCTLVFDGIKLERVGVRQSGGGIQGFRKINNKPSLSFKTNEFVMGQELLELDKFNIKNGNQDLGFLNEHMVYEIFRLAGLEARETAHAKVTINGVDSGIYVMREAIDKQFLARLYGNDNNNGNLYEIEFGKPGELTDDMGKKAAQYQPKDYQEEMRTNADLIAFANAIVTATAANTAEQIGAHTNIDRYLTYWATEMVTSYYDSFTFNANNSYLYFHPTQKFVMFPHGADEAMWAVANAGPNGRLLSLSQSPKSGLAKKLAAVPEFKAKYNAEVQRIGKLMMDRQQDLMARIDDVAKILSTIPQGERTGRTAADLVRFETYRPVVEAFVKGGGLVNSSVSSIPVTRPPPP